MKRWLLAVATLGWIFIPGCAGLKQDTRDVSVRIELTDEQKKTLKKYIFARGLVLNYFGLSESATVEDLRPHLARYLGLSPAASWETLAKDPRAQQVFNDERRRMYARIFGLSEDATWFDIKDEVERLREVFSRWQ